MGRTVLVTGGSGYFGTVVAEQALARGDQVRIFDLNPPALTQGEVEYLAGDIRDLAAVRSACDGVDVVLHNVAQVPLARDRELFDSVNVVGTANVLVAARRTRCQDRAHLVERRVRCSRVEPRRRRRAMPPGRGVRARQAARRAAVSRGGCRRPRRDDRPPAHDPRSRPARHLRGAVRLRGRGRAGLRARVG